jgi:hypothetical protein
VRRVGQLLSETKRRVLGAGVDPALVVRFELDLGVNLAELIDRLDEAGLQVVSIDSDKQAIVAFRADDDLRQFERAMDQFGAGPRAGKKGTKWDVLKYINPGTVRRWGRDDRIGPRLRVDGEVVRFEPEALYALDVELWHPGLAATARASLAKVRAFTEARGGFGARWVDDFVGHTLCLARVALLGRDVEQLLEVPEVAEVDLPPQLQVDSASMYAGLATPFPKPAPPPQLGPRLCVIDSGVASAHPLLGPFVGDASSVHSTVTSAADLHGHGTKVAGVAVFGDLRKHVDAGYFSSSMTVFSARILDDDSKLDPDKLVVNQIRAAVDHYRAPPYNCRVFNLSFGEERTFLDKSRGRQGLWAEVLDLIAAKHDIVFVVSAGNVPVRTTQREEAELLLTSRGRHLAEPRHRLVDPATSALAITVGAIAERTHTAVPRGAGALDLRLPVTQNAGEPSAFTRVGPGVVGAIKPDFVDEGGNLTWSNRGITVDPANAVLLFSNQWSGIRGWFQHDVGTSFAAPRVARVAAMLEHSLREQLQRAPSANLIRAVLGAGAVRAKDLDEPLGSGATVNVTGYGRVDEDFALYSSERRVVLFSEEEVPLDHFAMFEVPVPDEFSALRGKKHVTAAVAYDPPVRARRADYLGVGLDFHMHRDVDQDSLFDHYRRRAKDEEKAPKTGSLGMIPGAGKNTNFEWNRSNSTLQVGRYTFEKRPPAGPWWLVVRVRRKWAPRDYERQKFALAIVLEAAEGDFYARIEAQLRARGRARARV